MTVIGSPSPHQWVTEGIFPPSDEAVASVDAVPVGRQFCQLTPGALVVPEDALDGPKGPNCVYFGLWYATHRINLRVNDAWFACFVPQMVLPPDTRSGAPCSIGGCYASVFRVEGRRPTEIFCSSDVGGGDEFRALYDHDGFAGLEFELIWQGP